MLCTPLRLAWMPAGAVHTPVRVSLAAYAPATMPEGAKVRRLYL